MSDSVDRVFIHALQTVRKLPRTGSSRPPSHDRLRLYGLYKQSMEGDVLSIMPRPVAPDTTSTPSLLRQSSQSFDTDGSRSPESPNPSTIAAQKGEVEKWDAWHACAGMTRTEAKRKYIDYLIETMKRYASSTREGKELVGELEFVWDQIRNNTSNSHTGSGSSEDSGNGIRRSRLGPGNGVPASQIRTNNGSSGQSRPLRVLSPVSRGDDGDISGLEENEEAEDDGEGSQIRNDNHSPSDLDRRKPNPDASSISKSQQKWKEGLESALSRLSVEVAALREQMSDSRMFQRRRSGGAWAWMWMKWITWTIVRQILFDLLILGFAVLWGRRKGDRRLEDAVRRVFGRVRERIGKVLERRRFWGG